MRQYIIKRLLLMIPTLIGAALVVFLLINVVPGDIALLILGTEQGGDVNPQEVALLRERFGLNRPLYVQFLSWLWGMVRLDFGNSLWSGTPLLEELWIRLPLTLEIALLATLVSTILAIPLGTLAAIRRDTWFDYGVRVITIGGLPIRSFWTGVLSVLIFWMGIEFISFLVILFWIPPLIFVSQFDPWKNFGQLALPIVMVGYRNTAVITRITRSTVLEVMREDDIRTAWAEGLRQRMVVAKHTLKNAMLRAIALLGAEFALLMVVLYRVETAFSLPGLGGYMFDAILHRDVLVVRTLLLLTVFGFVFVKLIFSLFYAWRAHRFG